MERRVRCQEKERVFRKKMMVVIKIINNDYRIWRDLKERNEIWIAII